MKPQLHRSLTVWSGLLVMAFIGWAWWDSERIWTQADAGRFLVNNGWGGVMIEHFESNSLVNYRTDFGRQPAPYACHPLELLPAPRLLRPADVAEGEWAALNIRIYSYDPRDGPVPVSVDDMLRNNVRTLRLTQTGAHAYAAQTRDWILFIPHRLMILTVAAAWLGLLFWRARRRKRALHS